MPSEITSENLTEDKTKLSDVHTSDIDYYPDEEIANAVTHGIGVLMSIAALVLLVVRAARTGTAWHVTSYAIFGAGMIILYLSSTLFHSFRGKARRVFARMDHATIFVLIAASYTPFTLTSMRGPWGWTLFGIVWGAGLAGVVLKSIWLEKYHMASTWLYLIMGWIIVIAGREAVRTLPRLSLFYLILGGVIYSIGFFFYRWKSRKWTHAIWHLFVMGGTIMHFFAVWHLTD